MDTAHHLTYRKYPEPVALLRLIKPITWFPPIWAYLCGSVATGVSLWENFGLVLVGMILAGPIVCGMSQAANDWCDRHVDAVNEPDRPIPSGRVPGRWGLWIALAMTGLALGVGSILGPWGAAATLIGIAAAWAYSAEPIRLKRSGWWGPGLVGLSYEGLPWFTGSAVLLGALPSWENMLLALLYALGAHGIMTLNDFKALEGDRLHGVRSLPVVLGPERAAQVACVVMIAAQAGVAGLLFAWAQPFHATAIVALILGQMAAMRVLMRDPKARAPWYNGTGVVFYISGMMISAFALRGMS
ncbi:MAG TPA: chlorophyll synthase ChlG [Rhodobacteraceae bacterium]|nr:chlorophyll synthase ChlG [Paracoccaceae bacterium]